MAIDPDDAREFVAQVLSGELKHFGVKGMHWGVHKERQLQLHTRVARGTATRSERAAAFHYHGAAMVAARGGLKKASAVTARKLRAQKLRTKKGTTTPFDKATGVLSAHPADLLKKNRNIVKPR